MCGLCHASPKNHLLGKHPFHPCLFYAWPVCHPGKTTRINLAAFCACTLPVCEFVFHAQKWSRWTQNRRDGHSPGTQSMTYPRHLLSSWRHLCHCLLALHMLLSYGHLFWAPSTWASCNSLGTTRSEQNSLLIHTSSAFKWNFFRQFSCFVSA